ncbi:MAG: hypothetical protein JW963_08970 [Anaerolineales bacterium]|nr:hypothetical protein [Anaerolineales bacterium]
MTDTTKLPANQQRALAALLTEKDVRSAAKKCGLAENTIYRYLKNGQFRQLLQEAHAAIYSEVSNRLTVDVLDALDKLWVIVDTATDPNVKRLAIGDWLKHALKIREVDDLEARIAALEERLNNGHVG